MRAIRMGRLIEPAGNGRARLMIEIAHAKQNPAYRFAAVQRLVRKKMRRFFIFPYVIARNEAIASRKVST